jgi:REP element-mobilizing transposase RayT
MPRRARCVLPGVPYHVTQRGVDRQATFSIDEDRYTYLRLLRENLSEADVRVWAWCLMSNHLAGVPHSIPIMVLLSNSSTAVYPFITVADEKRSHRWSPQASLMSSGGWRILMFSSLCDAQAVGAALRVLSAGCAIEGACSTFYNAARVSAFA